MLLQQITPILQHDTLRNPQCDIVGREDGVGMEGFLREGTNEAQRTSRSTNIEAKSGRQLGARL